MCSLLDYYIEYIFIFVFSNHIEYISVHVFSSLLFAPLAHGPVPIELFVLLLVCSLTKSQLSSFVLLLMCSLTNVFSYKCVLLLMCFLTKSQLNSFVQ
jgi:hypothetical protein